jgi:hypothetical protein
MPWSGRSTATMEMSTLRSIRSGRDTPFDVAAAAWRAADSTHWQVTRQSERAIGHTLTHVHSASGAPPPIADSTQEGAVSRDVTGLAPSKLTARCRRPPPVAIAHPRWDTSCLTGSGARRRPNDNKIKELAAWRVLLGVKQNATPHSNCCVLSAIELPPVRGHKDASEPPPPTRLAGQSERPAR